MTDLHIVSLQQEMYQAQNQTFKKTFMSDPATYPLMVIMATATTFMIGMGIHAMTSYKDLRITPSAKHKIIQDWGEEQKRPIIAPVASHPFAFHRQSFKDIQYEGLGVNHDEWKKEREAKA
jgi:hypothetical protein